MISVVYFIVGAYGSNSGMLAPIQEIWVQFLADRTNGRAYGTVLRLSVVICNVCIVAKQCVLEQKLMLCLMTYKELNGLAPSYIADLCRPVTSVGSRQRLRSTTHGDPVVLSVPLSRTSVPVHLLWRVLRPGTNCRCTYEHRSQFARWH